MKSDLAIPPGELLREELAAREWTQADLAEVMGRPLNTINKIINGKSSITPQTAIQLGQALGGPAQFWLRLQIQYQLAKAGIK